MIWNWGSTSSGPPIHGRFLQWSRCVLKSLWLCRLVDVSYVMCTSLYMMVLYDRARVGPTTKTSDKISIICLFWLILQANPLFCLELWYSSCFEVKSWFHTFPNWCSHIPIWILILHDKRYCHVNPFQPVCLSSSGSDHFNIRKINCQFFSMMFVSSVSKSPLFSLPPTLVFSRTRIS